MVSPGATASTQLLHNNKHEHHLDHGSWGTLLMNVFLEEDGARGYFHE